LDASNKLVEAALNDIFALLPSSIGTNTPRDAIIDGRATPLIFEVTVNNNAALVASNSGDGDNTLRGDSKICYATQWQRKRCICLRS